MKIFIGNLPSQGTPEDLAELLQPFDCRTGIEYNAWQNPAGDLSYFAVVDVKTERAARKLIKNLCNKRVLDSHLEVRPFHPRHSYHNERRGLNWRDQQWGGEERRVRERRLGSVRLFAGE